MITPLPYTRKEVIGNATLYLGDCLEILPTLEKVDAVITDPPYGVDYAEWDEEIPDWLAVARAAAPIVIFTTGPTTVCRYPEPDWIAAYSRQGATTRNSLGGFCHWTPVMIYGKPKLPVDFRACNDKRAHLQAIRDGRSGHPSPKPIEVMEWLCGLVDGGVVCDPFAGSGTTGVACQNLGLAFIGIERDIASFELSCASIENAQRQVRMFA